MQPTVAAMVVGVRVVGGSVQSLAIKKINKVRLRLARVEVAVGQ